MNRMCELAGVSRAGFYRSRAPAPPTKPDEPLRMQLREIALRWPAYGSRRITAELRDRGWVINRKRVQRLMREENLRCRRKRKFVVTTDSNHGLKVFRNLARRMELTGIDQLWVADITYIRLSDEFVYLAVILDAYSRRVVGWELDGTLRDELSLAALEMAIERRSPTPGLVHHSDRGVQYASNDYTARLKQHQIQISMSRKGSPWDNAACESFMKTLKYEEVYRTEYRDLADARSRIGEFLEAIYNERRRHSALEYRSPAEFERLLPEPPPGSHDSRATV